MTDTKSKGDCFIIMPITTPETERSKYGGDKDHFKHVLECLLIPAVEKAGFKAISPEAKGSESIKAAIIKNLSIADLVLCDMSIFNPNVFYELGIRTALDKPIALVVDDYTEKPPFDIADLNYKPYKGSLNHWEMEDQINTMAEHISDAYAGAEGRNSMWKYFNVVAPAGVFKPGETTDDDRFAIIISELDVIRQSQDNGMSNAGEVERMNKLYRRISDWFHSKLSDLERDKLIKCADVDANNYTSYPHYLSELEYILRKMRILRFLPSRLEDFADWLVAQ